MVIHKDRIINKQDACPFSESDLLPLSALQHFLFCKRQCALIHIEQVWQENFFTAQGRILHERVDIQGDRKGDNCRVEYSVPLRSYTLGLVGKADVVEFHKKHINGQSTWIPYPVEYKRGRPKEKDWDRVQLCAQAICLEEQLETEVKEGSLFYGKTRRREKVKFNAELRKKTKDTAQQLHELIKAGITPRANYTSKCRSCSLRDWCMPRLPSNLVKKYIGKALEEL